MTYLFYDLETSGLCSSFDQIFRFACIITDSDLKEINRHEISVKLRPDVVPSATALSITHLSINDIKEGICEHEALIKIHSLFNQPNQINIGYNSLSFDNNMLRFGFYRNLLDPYTHQFKNNVFRADVMNINLLYYLYKRDVLSWGNDRPMKLENINNYNHLFDGKSHDAMVDVEVTVALARKLRDYDIRMWDYLINGFIKKNDLSRINKLSDIVINNKKYKIGIYTDIKLGYDNQCCCAVLYLGRHYNYKNQSLWMRLDYPNISDYFSSIDNMPRVIKRKDGEPAFILPYEKSYNYILGDERISNVKSNIKWLEKHYKRLEDLMIHEQERDYDDIKNIDIDASIYTQGLFNSEELSMINIFHSLDINQKLAYINNLENQRIKDLGLRIIFRNYPEQLDDTNKGLIIASIVHSNSVNFKKEKRRMPQDAIDEANGIIDNEDITQEQVTIINDYLDYLQSVKT